MTTGKGLMPNMAKKTVAKANNRPTKKNEDEDEVESEEEETVDDEEEEEEESDDDSSDDDDDSSSTDEDDEEIDIDYEAIAKAESERADRAEAKLAGKSFKDRKNKRDAKDEDDDDDEDRPVTQKDLKRFNAQTRRETQEGEIVRIANEISSSEAEARAIIATHANRIYPESLSLREQLEEAQAAVNRPKTKARESELRRAANGKDRMKTNAASSHRTNPGNSAPPKESKGTKAVLEEGKFKWSKEKGAYFKKLPNGKRLYTVPKPAPGQRKSWIE